MSLLTELGNPFLWRGYKDVAPTVLKRRQRLLNPRHDALLAENLEQVVEARAGGFAGHGQPAGMHQHAGFYAQRLGGFLERRFQAFGVERGGVRKGVAELFQSRLVLRHNAKFDFEKLVWLQGEYCRELPADRFYEMSVHALAKAGLDTNKLDVHYVKAALDTCKGKIKTFSELPAYAGFYFTDQVEYDAEAVKKDFVPENKPRLEKLRDAFGHAPAFNAESLEAALKDTAKTLGVKPGVLVHPCRLAVTGKTSGPSLYHLLQVLGKERVMARIGSALQMF